MILSCCVLYQVVEVISATEGEEAMVIEGRYLDLMLSQLGEGCIGSFAP